MPTIRPIPSEELDTALTNIAARHDPAVVQMRDALAYRRQLKASADLKGLAHHMMRIHYQYEGWTLPRPVPKELLRIYLLYAERAIRACDAVGASVGRTHACELAVRKWDRVVDAVNSAPDDDAKHRAITVFIEDAIATFEHHANGKSGISTAEIIQFNVEEAEDGL